MKKNVFEKKNEKMQFWNTLTDSEKHETMKACRDQIWGGDMDDELEQLFMDNFVNGKICTLAFLKNLVRAANDDKPFILDCR